MTEHIRAQKALARKERRKAEKLEAAYKPWRSDEAHAVTRARERFELKLTPQRYETLCERAKLTSLPVAKPQGTRQEVMFRYRQKWWCVIYDRATERIVTFLPRARVKKGLAYLEAHP